jgi:hypothetical protein
MILLSTKYCSGDQIKNTEMGGTCSTYGGKEKRVLVGNLREGTTWKTEV